MTATADVQQAEMNDRLALSKATSESEKDPGMVLVEKARRVVVVETERVKQARETATRSTDELKVAAAAPVLVDSVVAIRNPLVLLVHGFES